MYHRDKRAFICYLKNNASSAGEKTALYCDDYRYSRSDCFDLVCCLCYELSEKYSPDTVTKVIYSCEDTPNNILVLFALFSLGYDVVIANVPKEHIEIHYFDRSKNELTDTLNTAELIQTAKLHKENAYIPPDYDTQKTNIILCTSGTTAYPKGIILQQYAFFNNAQNLADCMELAESDKICLIPKIHHCFGLITLLSGVIKGIPVYFPQTKKTKSLLDKIRKHNITVVNTVPTIFLKMCHHTDFQSEAVSSVRCGIIAGGSYTPSQFRDIAERFSMKLMSSYGLTEGCATVTFCDKNDVETDCHVGKFIHGVDGCIKSPDGKLCPVGQEGEICFKGYNLMRGTVENELFVPCEVDRDGWYHTGDLGYLDRNERLHITGRIKDIIIRGGENISIAKLNGAALSHPNVLECATVGIPNDLYGEVPCIMLTSTEHIDETSFELYLEEKLMKYEMPEKIAFVKEIPSNENGKYDFWAIRRFFENT